jgi:predicted RNase H-like nuclease (RuvC/YqgF family)
MATLAVGRGASRSAILRTVEAKRSFKVNALHRFFCKDPQVAALEQELAEAKEERRAAAEERRAADARRMKQLQQEWEQLERKVKQLQQARNWLLWLVSEKTCQELCSVVYLMHLTGGALQSRREASSAWFSLSSGLG